MFTTVSKTNTFFPKKLFVFVSLFCSLEGKQKNRLTKTNNFFWKKSVCFGNCSSQPLTGHKRPPVMDQLQDATSSSSSSNTLSLLSSYTLSPLLSNNSSRSLMSVRSKTNLDNNSLFPSLSQSTKMARATQVKLNLPIIFFPFAIEIWVQCQKVSTIPHIKNGV